MTATPTARSTPDSGRLVRCRYLGRYDDRCTAQAVDPEGEIVLCAAHLGRALELVQRKMPVATGSGAGRGVTLHYGPTPPVVQYVPVPCDPRTGRPL